MKYHVVLIHPDYGPIKVIPEIVDRYQLDALCDFAEKHNEIVIVEEMYE